MRATGLPSPKVWDLEFLDELLDFCNPDPGIQNCPSAGTDTGFAAAFGGGLDIRISPALTFEQYRRTTTQLGSSAAGKRTSVSVLVSSSTNRRERLKELSRRIKGRTFESCRFTIRFFNKLSVSVVAN